MPIALSWAPQHADMHVVSCCARAYHREQRRHAIPIALAASHCPTARDFVPWRFLVAGRFSAWAVSSSRRPKTCTGQDMPHDTAGAAPLEFEQGILDCKSSCAFVGNFQPNSPTAMTASVRFDTFNALSIAVT